MTGDHVVLYLLAGAALGALHFAILWVSVRLLVRRRAPWLFAAGAFARLALALAALALAFAAGPTWTDLAAAALGFFGARLAATRLARRGAGAA
jgi:F1F0 ATPase subunit 2